MLTFKMVPLNMKVPKRTQIMRLSRRYKNVSVNSGFSIRFGMFYSEDFLQFPLRNVVFVMVRVFFPGVSLHRNSKIESFRL